MGRAYKQGIEGTQVRATSLKYCQIGSTRHSLDACACRAQGRKFKDAQDTVSRDI